MAEKWIAGAIKRPGSFTRQATAAGMTTKGFQRKVLAKGSQASGTTKKRAVLMRTLAGFRKK